MAEMTKAEWGEIIKRRFGSDHDKPCAEPTVTTCALVKCQLANRCQYRPPAAPWRTAHDHGRGACEADST